MIDIFDQDKEIDKYIISTEESFRDVIDYYRLYTDDTIYNKIYLVSFSVAYALKNWLQYSE